MEIIPVFNADVCCDIGQNDTIGKIELNPSSVLSTRDLNCQKNIQLFLPRHEKIRVYGDTN